MNSSPYKRMYLVSEDEFATLNKQVNVNAADVILKHNAVKTQNEEKLVSAPVTGYEEDDNQERVMKERRLQFHDDKHMHEAPKHNALDNDDDINWTNVPLDTYKWDILSKNIRAKARLLIMLVSKHANINDRQEFEHHVGTNIYDLVQLAVKSVKGKKAKSPFGWKICLHFLCINKYIPRSVLSKLTLVEIDKLSLNKIKKSKLEVPFFESLFK